MGSNVARLCLIAGRNLVQSRKRTLMLGTAILLVTMLLVLVNSLTTGIRNTMLRTVTTLSTGHVNVGGFYKITSGQAAPVVTNYEEVMKPVRASLPNDISVVDRVRGWGKVVNPSGEGRPMQLGLTGIDILQETGIIDVVEVIDGDLMDLTRTEVGHTAVLFEKQAKRLKVSVGDTITLSVVTPNRSNNAIDAQVVAICKDVGLMSAWNVFTRKDTIRTLYLLDPGATGAIQIYLEDADDAPATAEALRATLADSGYRIMEPEAKPFWMKFQTVTREDWTGQKLDVTTWEDELATIIWTLQALQGVKTIVFSVLLIIIIVGLMNSLWMAIRERTREIGTLRAIGMGRRSVLALFLLEAGMLSTVAAALGTLTGIGVAALLNAMEIHVGQGFQLFLMRDTLHLVIGASDIAIALTLIPACAILGALYPAYRAAKMKPVTALQHVS
jgi:ABC-type lipoprotein release transport system permease subunit